MYYDVKRMRSAFLRGCTLALCLFLPLSWAEPLPMCVGFPEANYITTGWPPLRAQCLFVALSLAHRVSCSAQATELALLLARASPSQHQLARLSCSVPALALPDAQSCAMTASQAVHACYPTRAPSALDSPGRPRLGHPGRCEMKPSGPSG